MYIKLHSIFTTHDKMEINKQIHVSNISFMCMICKSLFVLFLLAVMLSVLRFTDSDYPFGIFKLFSMHQDTCV